MPTAPVTRAATTVETWRRTEHIDAETVLCSEARIGPGDTVKVSRALVHRLLGEAGYELLGESNPSPQ